MKPVRAPRRSASFTLTEVLVAVTVLSFIVLMLAQVTGMANKALHEGMGRVDNATKSRAMLDLIASDLEHAVIRPDLPIFQTGGTYNTNSASSGGFTNGTYSPSLYTAVPGVSSSSVRNLSFVTYAIAVNPSSQGSDKVVLKRSDLPVPWSSTGSTVPVPFQGDLSGSTSAATAREVAPGVVGFQFSFRRMDGKVTTTYTGYDTNSVIAVGITLAVVGDRVLQQLSSAELNRIKQLFAGATPVSTTPISGVKAVWEAQLTPSFYESYPKDMATNLKIFERWVIPSQPF